MPDQFEFLSLDAFKKLSTDERQAYLEKVARYVRALTDAPIVNEKNKKEPRRPRRRLEG